MEQLQNLALVSLDRHITSVFNQPCVTLCEPLEFNFILFTFLLPHPLHRCGAYELCTLKLAPNVLIGNWKVALKELNTVREAIDLYLYWHKPTLQLPHQPALNSES